MKPLNDLKSLTLKIARQDPAIRRQLIAELAAEKIAGRSMQVDEGDSQGKGRGGMPGYVMQYIDQKLKGKKFKNTQTGREIGALRNMQVNDSFKRKVYQDAKKWWAKRQKAEEKNPKLQRERKQVNLALGEANKLIRRLEKPGASVKDVRQDAKETLRDLNKLEQRVRKTDPKQLSKLQKATKRLESLTQAKSRKDAPTLRGRKRKQAALAAEYAYRQLFG